MNEARIEKSSTGRVPTDDGWFILNLSDINPRSIEG